MLIPLWRSRRGATAAEFALVLPGVLFLVFGAFNLAIVLYAASSLQAAAEASARWVSIQTALNSGTAPALADVQTYAQNHYAGPGLTSLTFTSSTPGCGHSVSGSGTYELFYGFGALNVPVKAQACFP
jgi:Flp pilus assembly protein TadG